MISERAPCSFSDRLSRSASRIRAQQHCEQTRTARHTARTGQHSINKRVPNLKLATRLLSAWCLSGSESRSPPAFVFARRSALTSWANRCTLAPASICSSSLLPSPIHHSARQLLGRPPPPACTNSQTSPPRPGMAGRRWPRRRASRSRGQTTKCPSRLRSSVPRRPRPPRP
jgi:hypothetical protein